MAVIDEVRVRGDSCGGEVTCVVRRCPKGLGAPVFDKLEAELAKALMSLPASKARPQSRTEACTTVFERKVGGWGRQRLGQCARAWA